MGGDYIPRPDTRTPYHADYAGTDANKVTHYVLRWVSTRGEKGS